jgi:hypothetical protein
MKRLITLRKALTSSRAAHRHDGALLTEPDQPRCALPASCSCTTRAGSTMCGPRHHRRHDDGDRARADLLAPPGPRASAGVGGQPGMATSRPHRTSLRHPRGSRPRRARTCRIRRFMRVESVAFRNVASFVFRTIVMVPVGGRRIPVDVAFGGASMRSSMPKPRACRSMPRICRS